MKRTNDTATHDASPKRTNHGGARSNAGRPHSAQPKVFRPRLSSNSAQISQTWCGRLDQCYWIDQILLELHRRFLQLPNVVSNKMTPLEQLNSLFRNVHNFDDFSDSDPDWIDFNFDDGPEALEFDEGSDHSMDADEDPEPVASTTNPFAKIFIPSLYDIEQYESTHEATLLPFVEWVRLEKAKENLSTPELVPEMTKVQSIGPSSSMVPVDNEPRGSRGPKKGEGGRPAIQLEERKRLAVLTTKFGTSLSKSGALVSYLKGKKSASSRETSTRTLVEMNICLDYEIATKIMRSSYLNIGIDGSGTGLGRNFLELEFGGIFQHQPWCYLVSCCENPKFTNQGAGGEMELILETIKYYGGLIEQLGGQPKRLHDFACIVYDTASTNTGCNTGLGVRLEEKRRESWSQSDGKSTYIPLLRKGCEDHIINLIPKYFGKLVNQTFEPTPFKNIFTLLDRLIKSICNQCGGRDNHSEFKGFARALGVEKVSIKPIDESRYINLEEGAVFVYQYFNLIIFWYAISWAKLSAVSKKDFYELCNPDILALLKIRAVGNQLILKPHMKGMAENDSTVEAHTLMTYLLSKINFFRMAQPSLWNSFFVKFHKDCNIALPDYSRGVFGMLLKFGELKRQEEIFSGILDQFSLASVQQTLNQQCLSLKAHFEKELIITVNRPQFPPQHYHELVALEAGIKAAQATRMQRLTHEWTRELFHPYGLWCIPGRPLAQDFDQRIFLYGSKYFEAIATKLYEKNGQFFHEVQNITVPIYVKTTNRSGETNFGGMKSVLSKQSVRLRAINLEGYLKAKRFTIDQIHQAFDDFWERFNIIEKARVVLKNAQTGKQIENERWQIRKESLREITEKKQKQAEEQTLSRMLQAYLIFLGYLSEKDRITKEVLRSYLERNRIQFEKTHTKMEMMSLIIPPVIEWLKVKSRHHHVPVRMEAIQPLQIQ